MGEYLLRLFFPMEGFSVVVIIVSLLNILFILFGTVVFSYILIAIFAGYRPTKRTAVLAVLSVSIVVFILMLLHSYTVYNQHPDDFTGFLLLVLNPMFGINGFASNPSTWFGVNLLLRYILLIPIITALRFSIHFAKKIRKSFSLFLEKVGHLLNSGSASVPATVAGTPPSLSLSGVSPAQAVANLLQKPIRLIGLLVFTFTAFAFILGGESPATQVSALFTSVLNVIEVILPLGMVAPADDTSFDALLRNFAIVLLIIFIATFYVAIILVFFAFLNSVRKNYKRIAAWLKKRPWIWKGFLVIIVGTLLVLMIYFTVGNYANLVQAFSFVHDISSLSGARQIFAITVMVTGITFAIAIIILAASLFVSFVFSIIVYFYSATARKIELIREQNAKEEYRKNRLVLLFQYVGHSFLRFIESIIEAFLGVFIKPTRKISFSMGHAAIGLFAIASFFNTFLGFMYFYVPINSVITNGSNGYIPRWVYFLVSLTVSAAIQIGIVVFGLKAGEVYGANVKKLKLWRFGRCTVPYLLFLFISVVFAYTNLFSRFANTAEIRATLYNEIRVQADEILNLRGTATNLADFYDNTKRDASNLLNNRTRQLEQRRSVARTRLDSAAENEARNAPSEWHRRNERDAFITETSLLDILSDAIQDLLYLDFEAFGRVEISVTNYNHFFETNPTVLSASRSIRYSEFSGTTVTIGEDFRQPHPLTRGVDASVRNYFISSLRAGYDWSNVNIQTYFLPDGRLVGRSPRQSVEIASSFPLPQSHKYQLMFMLLRQFESTASYIENVYSPISNQFRQRNMFTFQPQSQFYNRFKEYVDRLGQIDDIRHNIATIYRSIDDVDNNLFVTVGHLPYITPDILDRIISTSITLLELQEYVETSITIHTVFSTNAEVGRFMHGSEKSADDLRSYLVYAESISNSDFLLSFDILFRGNLFNEHKDELNSIYSSWFLAIVFVFICLIKDIAAFFVGMTHYRNKPVYNFTPKSKDSILYRIGYLNFNEQLAIFFEMPSEEEISKLHKIFVDDLLTGSAPKNSPSVDYKNVKEGQLKHVFDIDMEDDADKAALRTWLDDYLKGSQ